MKGKGKVMAMAAVMGLGLILLAAGGTVRVSDTVIGHAVIAATPEEVLAWMGTEGEGYLMDKNTKTGTYPWWPGYQFKTLDGLTVGESFSYTAEYGGTKFSGEGVGLGPIPERPGVPSVTKFAGGHPATWTTLIVPVEKGTKLIFVLEYALEAPAGSEVKVKKDVEDHMANAVKIIKDGVEKKKAAPPATPPKK